MVQEAVQFCVTVCEFSVANALSGVRRMLPLVWSTDPTIKDSVVQAYRRLYLNPQGDSTRWGAVIICHEGPWHYGLKHVYSETKLDNIH